MIPKDSSTMALNVLTVEVIGTNPHGSFEEHQIRIHAPLQVIKILLKVSFKGPDFIRKFKLVLLITFYQGTFPGAFMRPTRPQHVTNWGQILMGSPNLFILFLIWTFF